MFTDLKSILNSWKVGEVGMIHIDMPMPEKCSDCIFCNDNCSCVASDYDGLGINVGCAYRTGRRDIRCPLKEQEAVVRCKDCKHYEPDEYCPGFGDCMGACDNLVNVHENWFCADGERRE